MVSTYSGVSSAAEERLASEMSSGGSVGSRPVATIEAENPWGSCGITLRVSIIPGTLSTQAFGGRSFQQACTEHVIQGPMASHVDRVEGA